jgi:hypothetical protein
VEAKKYQILHVGKYEDVDRIIFSTYVIGFGYWLKMSDFYVTESIERKGNAMLKLQK